MITIVDYGCGNLGSIANMINRLGFNAEVTSDYQKIETAKKIILPGVGRFDYAIGNIKRLNLFDVLIQKTKTEKIPTLGICLGMQIMCKNSEEGVLDGLGIVDANVLKFNFNDNIKLKIPHMGWNQVKVEKNSNLFNIENNFYRYYFVHSYYVVCNEANDILTSTEYGIIFTSSFEHENIIGVQFHPEKSHRFGMELINRFINNY